MPDEKQLSKFLSLILRHKAEEFGLTLDSEGFSDLDAVWEQIQKKYGKRYTPADLDSLLTNVEGGKQRFERRDNLIRALYGHSAVTEIEYEAVTPPNILYHGTPTTALNSIRKHGLIPQKRQYVHLSTNTARASDVAGRHGKPVLLRVKALEAHDAGLIFYRPEPQHYLIKAVPPEYILFPEDDSLGG